jgi:RraA family protein
MSSTALDSGRRHDAEVISLVGLAHGTSHFFHLLLPPLFPWLMPEFGLSYTQAGFLMTVFFVISGIGQALAGFVVDRVGARPVLFFGIAMLVASALLLGIADSYAGLIAAAAIAGVGNSIFHPADFTLLNRRVSAARLGHAFSVHGLSGNLGWAAAPVFVAGIASIAGWHVAAFAAAGVGTAVLSLLLVRRDSLHDVEHAVVAAGRTQHAAGAAPSAGQFAFLRSAAVWTCFLFFFLATGAFGILQNYAPSILGEGHGRVDGLPARQCGGNGGGRFHRDASNRQRSRDRDGARCGGIDGAAARQFMGVGLDGVAGDGGDGVRCRSRRAQSRPAGAQGRDRAVRQGFLRSRLRVRVLGARHRARHGAGRGRSAARRRSLLGGDGGGSRVAGGSAAVCSSRRPRNAGSNRRGKVRAGDVNDIPATTDLCDAHEKALLEGRLQILAPGLLCFGRRVRFAGPATTLKLFEDNSLLAEAVKTAGEGRVLVVDAGGSLRCAVLGGNLAKAAEANQWQGAVIFGAVRDADEIDACEIGVRALAVHPRRSQKRGAGERDVPVSFLGATIRPGDWIYADRDGVLVSPVSLRA